MTREQLIFAVFGVWPTGDLSKDPHDRKVRRVIESLRDRPLPIVANSAEAGYRLDTSEEAIQKMVDELESRRSKLDVRVSRLRLILERIKGSDAERARYMPSALPDELKQMQFI